MDGLIHGPKGRPLAGAKTTSGYLQVSVRRDSNDRRICYSAHRLVALAYVPNPLSLPQVNHKDGDKLNNKPDNLEWMTAKENIHHAISTGNFSMGKMEKCRFASLTSESFPRLVELVYGGERISVAARKIAVSIGCIWNALRDNRWNSCLSPEQMEKLEAIRVGWLLDSYRDKKRKTMIFTMRRRGHMWREIASVTGLTVSYVQRIYKSGVITKWMGH